MDRIECMKSFIRVVEAGSFSAVARELETTQPTVSKQIATLEDYLDVQLLIRSTKALKLTDEGIRFYEHCQQVLDVIAEAEASVGKRQKPSGLLRLSCPVAFGQMQVVPRIKLFLDRYPEIKVNLVMTDQFIDLVEEGMDLAIRIGEVHDPSLIAHRIGTTQRVAIGSNSYFERAGEPQIPSDLTDHNCIVYTRLATGNEWHFQSSTGLVTVKVSGNFQANNSIAIREAVLSGLGIAVTPLWLLGNQSDQDQLKIVLREYQPTPLPIHAVYRRGRFQSAKVRCLIDFFVNQFKLDPGVSN
ncbi:MAG: LysR family transcriptional regulator [Leptolyngbyaceae cyanobacterium SL_7_1]|nr:LysR family transcriptional regulator [Leptolyngbyaceae cyanobacterium SL_7_1]